MQGPWHNEETHRTIDDYLKTHDGVDAMPLFKGSKQYNLLKDLGYLMAGTGIRVMHSEPGAMDEVYSVTSDYKLKDIKSEKDALHEPETILDREFPWELLDFNPDPIPIAIKDRDKYERHYGFKEYESLLGNRQLNPGNTVIVQSFVDYVDGKKLNLSYLEIQDNGKLRGDRNPRKILQGKHWYVKRAEFR